MPVNDLGRACTKHVPWVYNFLFSIKFRPATKYEFCSLGNSEGRWRTNPGLSVHASGSGGIVEPRELLRLLWQTRRFLAAFRGSSQAIQDSNLLEMGRCLYLDLWLFLQYFKLYASVPQYSEYPSIRAGIHAALAIDSLHHWLLCQL